MQLPARLSVALAALAALVLVASCAPVGAVAPPAPGSSRLPGSAVQDRPERDALRLLREWDRRRTAAYAAGEPHALRRLYAPGSRAGARDARVLRGYAERGLVVEQLTVQLLDARLLTREAGVLRLSVVERVAGGTVRPDKARGPGVTLPTTQPTRRVVTMIDTDAGWVVRAVRRR